MPTAAEATHRAVFTWLRLGLKLGLKLGLGLGFREGLRLWSWLWLGLGPCAHRHLLGGAEDEHLLTAHGLLEAERRHAIGVLLQRWDAPG